MDRKTASLVGAAAAIAAAPIGATAQAQEPAVPVAASYADLLQPIPNAVERLRLVQTEDSERAKLIDAQYVPGPYAGAAHHHHHHHHSHSRRWYRSHGYWYRGGAWVMRPVPHHHHHHHHHHNNY